MKRPWALPLVPLYAAGVGLRSLGFQWGWKSVRGPGWPVVSVGNLSAGGAGKTPFTIALAGLLKREGVWVDVLSRGYGRSATAVERVDKDGTAERFGDEPLLIARSAAVPVYVGARRLEAARLAERDGVLGWGVHLLDDGFQHRQLHRDVDIVLAGSEDLADTLLPAGNLREPLAALRRASVLAVSREDEAAVARLERLGLFDMGKQLWRFRREMILPDGLADSEAVARPEVSGPAMSGPVVAFCGIARPGQFFEGLAARGVELAGQMAFGDHHRFSAGDVEALAGLVRKTAAQALVTTEKDWVRLGGLTTELGRIAPLIPIGLRVVLEDEAGIAAWLREQIGSR